MASVGLIKFSILFLDAKFAKNKNSKLPKLSGCLYVWVYDLAASGYSIAETLKECLLQHLVLCQLDIGDPLCPEHLHQDQLNVVQ